MDSTVKNSWYFLRLGFLAIPWRSRNSKNPKGIFCKHYYLLKSQNIKSAFKEADSILEAAESLKKGGRIKGKLYIYKKIGILDLEPLYQPLEGGCEIFDESETGVTLSQAALNVLTKSGRARLLKYEKTHGKQILIPVYHGDQSRAQGKT